MILVLGTLFTAAMLGGSGHDTSDEVCDAAAERLIAVQIAEYGVSSGVDVASMRLRQLESNRDLLKEKGGPATCGLVLAMSWEQLGAMVRDAR